MGKAWAVDAIALNLLTELESTDCSMAWVLERFRL